jgi:hypothetical protein
MDTNDKIADPKQAQQNRLEEESDLPILDSEPPLKLALTQGFGGISETVSRGSRPACEHRVFRSPEQKP